MDSDEKLTERTIKIIDKGGRIVLKDKRSKYYLGQWTNLVSGEAGEWVSNSTSAMEFGTLKVAYAIAPLFTCKVVVVYPKKTNNVLCPTCDKIKIAVDKIVHRMNTPEGKAALKTAADATRLYTAELNKTMKR